jgi:hypothetical protein
MEIEVKEEKNDNPKYKPYQIGDVIGKYFPKITYIVRKQEPYANKLSKDRYQK